MALTILIRSSAFELWTEKKELIGLVIRRLLILISRSVLITLS